MVIARLPFLDGLRGLAIAAVVLYHAFSRWNSIEPYSVPEVLSGVVSFGWLGVQLFFAISGFVIYMTLQRCSSWFIFAKARYTRLAPAMLVGSLLIFLASFWLPERPGGSLNIADWLPSLSFISPTVWSALTGLEVQSMDGAFWSLYVEVYFYALVALLFYVFRDAHLIGLIFIYFLYHLSTGFLGYGQEGALLTHLLLIVFGELGVVYYGWFLVGIWAFKYLQNPSQTNMITMLVFALLSVWTQGERQAEVMLASLFTILLFLLPVIWVNVRRLLEARFLVWLGYVSYPLYLLHQNFVTGLAIKLHQYEPSLAGYLYPVPGMLLVLFISYVLASNEPLMRRKFDRIIVSSVHKWRANA